MTRARAFTTVSAITLAGALVAWAAPDPADAFGMRTGAAAVASMGAMTFGPENVLFIGDSQGASVLAVRVEEGAKAGSGAIDVAGIDAKVAQVLGTAAEDIAINDMAVHPVSRNVYLSVTRGRGNDARPALIRVTRDAARPIEVVSLDNVKFTTAAIPNAPASDPEARRNPRSFTVTDLAYADGQLYVAGLSNEEFSSAFRRMPFPFGSDMATTTLEIYHVSHGRNETNAPVMTFIPKRIDGKMYILAAYTCTPLVAFPVDEMKDGQHVFGRTVAELGAGNQPLDMIAYGQGAGETVLIANSRHPLMKVTPSDIAGAKALVSPTKDAGIKWVAVERQGIRQLDDLDGTSIVVLQAGENGRLDLKTVAKSAL
jgi:hypothetical protein